MLNDWIKIRVTGKTVQLDSFQQQNGALVAILEANGYQIKIEVKVEEATWKSESHVVHDKEADYAALAFQPIYGIPNGKIA